ncbi:MAG TPA: S-layer protein domain-containing protein, partial [archaeon]|nr:S-layer protein domain-containing protein [archaeon]
MRGIKNFALGLLVVLLFIGIVGTAQAALPEFYSNSTSPSSSYTSLLHESIDFIVVSNQTMDTFYWYIGGIFVENTSSGTSSTHSNNSTPVGNYNVKVIATNANGNISNQWNWTVNSPPGPNLTSHDPNSSFSSYENVSQTFNIFVDQNVDVVWYLNGNNVATSTDGPGTLQYINSSSVIGNDYNVTVFVNNTNGSKSFKWTWDVVTTPPPSITRTPTNGRPTIEVNHNQEFGISIDQPVNITWLMNGTSIKPPETLKTNSNYNNSTAPIGTYNITVNVKNVNGTNSTTWIWSVVPKPVIFTKIEPPASSNPSNLVGETITFKVELNQACAVNWSIDGGSPVQTNASPVTSASFSTSKSLTGNFTVKAVATNLSSKATNYTTWTWKVNPAEFFSGNRIWDANEKLSTTYTWDAWSFGGFYYDLDSNEGGETLTITGIDWSLGDDDVVYTAKPISVKFERTAFGEYYVIGFMAERYFAGYKSGSIGDSNDNLLDDDKLSKVLIDNDDSQMVRAGQVLALEEGYDFRIIELDVQGNQALVGIFKDDRKVEEDILSGGETLVYKVDGIPIIGIHINSVFAGMESSSIRVDGIFQISDKFTSVNNGEKFGLMTIETVSSNEIVMKNRNSISLSKYKGESFNLMGKINIEVGDSNVLRFAPVVDTSEPGTYELRGTVTVEEDPIWTPLNFEGLLYDMDSGFGSESLSMKRENIGDRSIGTGDLKYTTKPISVNFEHKTDGWNSYQAIGFMGDKYFAGYIKNSTFITTDRSLIGEERLGKILTDEDKSYSLRLGNPLTLQEGYSLQIADISRNGDLVMIA